MSHKTPHGSANRPAPTINLNIWAIGLSLGLKIALPLVVSVLIAIKLDKLLGTLPLFTIIAMVGSFILSAVMISQDIRRVNAQNSQTPQRPV